jgi:putative glycosyltransferase (TIGR04372 family)
MILFLLKARLENKCQVARNFLKKIAVIVCTPLTFLMRLSGYYILNINTKRIGHLCIDVDAFIKENKLANKPTKKAILLCPNGSVANRYLITYFRPYLTVITSNLICIFFNVLKLNKKIVFDCSEYTETKKSATAYLIQSRWEELFPPLFKLSDEDEIFGKNEILKIGLPKDAWWVCIHSRESGYSGRNDFGQGYRNSSIRNYEAAISEVRLRGGWCLRMGDPSMQKLSPQAGVIDYAHHPSRSDFLDVYLPAKSKLYLGNTSGAFALASIFGAPIATANMVPITAVFPYGKNDISIPKLYARNGKNLSFKQMFSSDIASARDEVYYSKTNLTVFENDPDDIRDLVREGLDRVFGVYERLEIDDILSVKFRKNMTNGDHSFYSTSSICSYFLRKHIKLLDE